MFQPPEVVDLLGQLRALGVSERAVRTERDGWILVAALSPELIPGWVSQKRSALADPEFQRLYLAVDEAFGWDPDDPRLEKLADWVVAWTVRHQAGPRQAPADVPAAVTLVTSDAATSSPAWRRLTELARDRLPSQGDGSGG